MTDLISAGASGHTAAPHGFRTRPHPASAAPGTHNRYVAYCVCGNWTSGILAVGAQPGVMLIEAFAAHAFGDGPDGEIDPAAGKRALVAAADEVRGHHPLSVVPYPPGIPPENATQYVMHCACTTWSSDILSSGDPAADAWLAAHQAHDERARLEYLANRRAGLPTAAEPTAEWAIDARQRARAAVDRLRHESGGGGAAPAA